MRERRATHKTGKRPEGASGRPDKHRATVDSNTLEEQCHPRKIFIGGLAHKTTTQHLRDHFGRFGAIVDAVVLRWPDGRSRGFGYVTFADAHAAHCTLQQTHQLSGREVDVKRAVPGTNKLFVGGLPQNTSANELREHFEKFGVVSDAVVMIDPATSRSRGFGFVCFLPGQEGAAAVTASLDHYDNHRIRGKWIEVKSAAPPHKLVPSSKGGSVSPSVQEESKLDAESDYDGIPTEVIQADGHLMSASHRENENMQPNLQQGSEKLGSPVKVALPTASVRQPLHSPPPDHLRQSHVPGPLQSPPPGLGAIYAQDYAAGTASVPPWQAHNPWWPGPATRQNPWSAPSLSSGLGGTSVFSNGGGLQGTLQGAGSNPMSARNGTMSASASASGDELGESGASSLVGEDGLSAAESLRNNLEQLLRRSLQSKVDAGAGASMYASPQCSTSTQTDVATLPVAADIA